MDRRTEGVAPTRRQFLEAGASAALVFGAGGVLSACGSSSSSSATSSATGPAKHGGTLRVSVTGGTSADTIDPLNLFTNMDFARGFQLYEPLVVFGSDALPQNVLAEEITPAPDAKSWTIRVRKGITFHNGAELTANEVIASFHRALTPKNFTNIGLGIQAVDAPAITKLDKYTIRVPCKTPFSTLDLELAAYNFNIGYPPWNPKGPFIGTGPFKYVSFTPGQQSVFDRNENYWQTGLPYVDKVIITDYADETSQLNALVGGQVDLIAQISSVGIPQAKSAGGKVVTSLGGGFTPLVMRVTVEPFIDPNVRLAMRLIQGRKQMLDLVFAGSGLIANDISSIWDPQYDHSIPQREQDIDQAKSLLKAAGKENMTLQLVTATGAQGIVKLCEVYAQQAASAGVTVNIRQVSSTEFFGPNYLKWPFSTSYWEYYPYLSQCQQSTIPTAPYNETNFHDPTYNNLYTQAISTVDKAKQTQIVHEMQMIDYNLGGYMIPYFSPTIDVAGHNVNGLLPSKTGLSFNNFAFKRLWFS